MGMRVEVKSEFRYARLSNQRSMASSTVYDGGGLVSRRTVAGEALAKRAKLFTE